jgi:hypothetical protein
MPTPNKGESKSDFISRCIPYVIREGTTDDSSQAAAICHSIWKKSKEKNNMKGERVLLHLSAKLKPSTTTFSKKNEFDIEDTTLIVGNGTYNGLYFPTEELEKGFLTFQGVPININHSDDRIEDIVGYVDKPYMKNERIKGKTIFTKGTAKYDATMGYIKSRFEAKDYPNVSIGVWVDRVAEQMDDSDDVRMTARNLKADHLAVVVHGACNPESGCGIGMSENYYYPYIYTGSDPIRGDVEVTFTYSENKDEEVKKAVLTQEIEREKLKKEIIKERRI